MSYTSSDGRRFSDDGESLDSGNYIPSSRDFGHADAANNSATSDNPRCMTCGSTNCRGCNGLPFGVDKNC